MDESRRAKYESDKIELERRLEDSRKIKLREIIIPLQGYSMYRKRVGRSVSDLFNDEENLSPREEMLNSTEEFAKMGIYFEKTGNRMLGLWVWHTFYTAAVACSAAYAYTNQVWDQLPF